MTGLSSPEEEEPLDANPPAAPALLSAVLDGSAHEDVVISWSLSTDDGAGDNDVSHYAVYFSQVYDYDGDGYSYLGQVGSGETQFTHTLAGDGDWNDYFYCVQANDTSGNTNWSGQAGKFVRNMEEGKQLASIPLIQDDTTLEVVLQTLKGSFKHVRYYKSSDQSDHWKSYWTFKTYGDLHEIDHKMGFWIDIKKADHLVVAGLVPDVTEIGFGHGWNLVGYPSFIEMTISEALVDVDWEKAQGYGDVSPFHQIQLTGDDIMTAGEGYWIWVDLPQLWNVSFKPPVHPYILWTSPADGETDVSLNATVLVKFSKEMNISSVAWTTIPDPAGYNLNWSEGNTLLEIHRVGGWEESMNYTIAITQAEDMEGNALVPGPVPNPWSFTTVSIIRPYIVSTNPPDHTVDLPVDMNVVVWFSEPMDTASVTWIITPSIAFHPLWSNGDMTLTLTHTMPFDECTQYTIEINGMDLDGNPLVPGPVPNPFSFETGCVCTGPCIIETNPYDGEQDVELDRDITIIFSEPINSSSLTWSVYPDPHPGAWSEVWSNNNTVVALVHILPFDECTLYYFHVLYAEDLDGNPLVPGPVPNPWSFDTGCAAPRVVMTDPYDGETNVELYRSITVYFSEPMNTSSFAWTVAPNPGGWYEDWRWNDTVVILGHVNPFSPCTTYYVRVTSAEDKDGNPLVPGPVPNPWTFEVASCPYILLSDPTANETDVNTTQDIYIEFSDPMNASTLLWKINPDPGRWHVIWPSDTVVVLVHSDPFQPNTTYLFELTYIENIWGVPLCSYPVSWSFTTGA